MSGALSPRSHYCLMTLFLHSDNPQFSFTFQPCSFWRLWLRLCFVLHHLFLLVSFLRSPFASVSCTRSFISLFLRHRRFPLLLNWILPSSGLLRGVSWFKSDVPGLPIGPIFTCQAVWTDWLLKMGPIGSPETSVASSRVNLPKTITRLWVGLNQTFRDYLSVTSSKATLTLADGTDR